jgi:hypothetical protein
LDKYSKILQNAWYILAEDKKKGKAIPLQAWTDPEGSRRLKLPDLKTMST